MGKQNSKRVPTQVHTRKLDRLVAHTRMKRKGLTRLHKNGYFADRWREFV